MQEGKEKDKKGTNNCLKFYTPAYYCPIHFPHGLLSVPLCAHLSVWVVMDILGEDGTPEQHPRMLFSKIREVGPGFCLNTLSHHCIETPRNE